MAKVKITGHASGSGVITVTAPNTSTDRTITLPDGDVTLGAATPSITDNGNANAITIDSAENVGIGVTPEAWHNDYRNLAVGGTGALWSQKAVGTGKAMGVGQNVYYDGSNKYITTDEASRYYQANGVHTFEVAASGSADAAITWTTAMTIANNAQIKMSGYNGGSSARLCVETQDVGGGGMLVRVTSAANENKTAIQFQDSAEHSLGVISCNPANNTTSYGTSSDYRLKENIVDMTGGITKLKLLQPRTFDWKSTGDTVNGFIAHEAATVVPEAVSGTKDAIKPEVLYAEGDTLPEGKNVGDVKRAAMPNYQNIDQAKLVPILTTALQEAVAKIEALEIRITALEA